MLPCLAKHGLDTQRLWCALAAMSFVIGCESAVPNRPWELASTEQGLAVTDGDQTLLRYRDRAVPRKPYVEKLHTPAGVNILRDAPSDHLHHHGLMFAVNVNDVEFWTEPETAGQQVVRETRDLTPATRGDWHISGFTQAIDWVLRDEDPPLLFEDRTITAWRKEGTAVSLITWTSSLRLPDFGEPVALTGERYFGLGMRFVASMDTGGRFFNADAGTGVKATNDQRADWCAYTAAADGHTVTVAMFDHPGNPRHPATWFTMDTPFAYLAATPSLHYESLALSPGQVLSFQFGVALWDGTIDAEMIDALYQEWLRVLSPAETASAPSAP